MNRTLVILAVFLVIPVCLMADNSKISPDLQGYSSTTPVQVIVQYAPGTQIDCSGILGLLVCAVGDILNLGGTLLSELPLVNGVVALLDGNGIVALSNKSDVVYISKDRGLAPLLNNATGAVNASAAWKAGYTGSGIGV